MIDGSLWSEGADTEPGNRIWGLKSDIKCGKRTDPVRSDRTVETTDQPVTDSTDPSSPTPGP